jgi:hypothetical protein
MAREPRTRRRLLARFFIGLIEKTPRNVRATRVVLPSKPGDPHYLFLVLPEMVEDSYEKYREMRRALLGTYCEITKLECPDAERIIGIATESGRGEAGSEDYLLYDASNWTVMDRQQALQMKTEMIELGLLGERKRHEGVEREFPDVPLGSQQLQSAIFR